MTERIVPQIVNIELTNRCNLACVFCDHARLKQSMEIGNFEDDLLLSLLESLTDHNIYEIGLVGLGEPLLDRNFERHLQIIGSYKKNFQRISLNSNAVALTEEKSNQILESCVNLVTFSLNATNRLSYQRMMKKDLFGVVVENIHRFLEIRNENQFHKTKVSIQFMSSDLNDQTEMEDLFVDYIDEDTIVYERHVFQKSAIEEYVRNVVKVNKISTQVCHPCWSLYSRSYIDIEGNVYPCTMGNDSYRKQSTMNLGNIRDQHLVDIFNNELITSARLKAEGMELAFDECLDCTLWELFPNNFVLEGDKWIFKGSKQLRKEELDRKD